MTSWWHVENILLEKGGGEFFMIPWREKLVWGKAFQEMCFNPEVHRRNTEHRKNERSCIT